MFPSMREQFSSENESFAGNVLRQVGSPTNGVLLSSGNRKTDNVEADSQEGGNPPGPIVWEKRLAFADIKRKFPTLNDKLDEEF